MPTITHKLPNGKLVRLSINGEKSISSIRITGDFFCYPEEAIEQMEQLLLGTPFSINAVAIKSKLDAYINDNKVTLVGITTEAVASMIVEALNHD